jgi:hypothetical protein
MEFLYIFSTMRISAKYQQQDKVLRWANEYKQWKWIVNYSMRNFSIFFNEIVKQFNIVTFPFSWFVVQKIDGIVVSY